MITSVILSTLLGQASPAPVTLERKFSKGEELTYSVRSNLTSSKRLPGLQTFLPRDFGFEYDFTTKVAAVDSDGNANVIYSRPKTTSINGAFADQPETRRSEPGGSLNLDLKVSTINELLEVKDLAAKPKTLLAMNRRQGVLDQVAGQFMGDIYRIALMVGSLDSTLDFAPKLPLFPVKEGATWKKTVGYSPQKLAGTGRQAVQRLDFTYTYVGLTTTEKGKVQRITAVLELETDMGTYINQVYGLKPSESRIKSIPTKFKSNLTFDLDPKTLRTISGYAESEGSTQLDVVFQSTPYEEEKFYGESRLKLIKVK